MSKIICDICGTSYPETAKQCPICGSVRPGDAKRVTNEVNSDGKVSTGYTYVKGGRFSKSNVKKRTRAQSGGVEKVKTSTQKKQNNEVPKSNRGLVVIAIILLLAIIAVVAYIAIRFFAPISDPVGGNTTDNLGSDLDLSCRDMTLDTYTVLIEQAGEAKLLNVKTTPEKPAEPVTFSSENEAVATVTEKGKITAVAEGTTKITVTCGNITKECTVTVRFTNQDTTPEESTPEDTTLPTTEPDVTVPNGGEELRLNRKDFTLSYEGESWVLYDGDIAKNLITWSSDDETIVTFTDGKAVAVGNGTTQIHAEYNGQKVSCIVRCIFKESSGVIGNGGVSEDGGGSSSVTPDNGSSGGTSSGNYGIYTRWGKSEDFTMKVGDSVKLELKDDSGNTVNAKWEVSGSGISISGSTVTGVSKTGYAKVIATYNGKGYECIVRVG